MGAPDKRHFGFIPVPALFIILAILHLVVKPTLFFEPAWLLPVTNTLFVTVVCLIIAYIAARNYRGSGRVQILLLGCGVFAFGMAAILAAFLRNVPETGANLNVTIYNTGALIAAIFHLIAALILLSGISRDTESKRTGLWVWGSYSGLAVFMGLLTVASMKGVIPPFFAQGAGATPLRQGVLGTADVLFAFSFLIFMGAYLRNGEAFLYWYASALALISISLTGFLIQTAVGSPIGWASRFSQYLGGIYFLVAVRSAVRGAQARRTSFDTVLTNALSPGEEKFRALSENSPDIITRFDREARYVYINPAGLRLYGKPAASVLGKTVLETGLPEDYCRALWKGIAKVFETGRPAQMEGWVPAGETAFFYQSRCVPEYGPDGRVANVLVVSRDLTEPKRAETALRESEERYRTIVETANEGIWIIGAEGTTTFVNNRMADILGYDPQEMTGVSALDFMDEEGKALARAREEHRRRGISESFEFKFIRKDGSPVWIMANIVPRRDRDRRLIGTIGMFTDITRRKEAERKILQQNRVLEGINRIFGEALTASTDEDLGRTCLSVAEEITGSRLGFIGEIGRDGLLHDIAISDPGWELCAMDDKSGHRRPVGDFKIHGIYGRVLKDGKGFFANDPASHLDRVGLPPGHPPLTAFLGVPLVNGGRAVGMIAVANREGGYTDAELGSLEGLAPAVMEAFSRKRAELERERLFEEARDARERLREHAEELERRVEERTGQLSAAYERLKQETTEREQAEARLRQSHKMEALGTLSGGIAHDFNNILAAVIGFSELAADHVDKGSRGEHYVNRILEASLRGRELVKQMLSFSRQTRQERKPVLLSSIVKETIKLLRASTPAFISIRTGIAADSGLILADPTEIQQVIMNLCTNAVYAMREKGGVLDIRLSNIDMSSSEGSRHAVDPGPYVKLTVSDTGAGMSPDIIDRIYDPFFTTKALGEGTGLGLSVAHGIVEEFNGYICVESEPGKGSTFSVCFPEISGEAAYEREEDSAIPTGTERILFVDDEEAIIELGEKILAELGYEVTSRRNGQEALLLLSQDPSSFDLILTDVTMPEMTGVELARKALSMRPAMPIVMCTGHSHLIDADTAKSAGIKAFVMKPLTKREIARTIRQALDG